MRTIVGASCLLVATVSTATTTEIHAQENERQRVNSYVYRAIIDRLGLPWREGGADDRGYDCSGLVWRVFSEAGVNLKRKSTRNLWEDLPEATVAERGEFGTLVFFNDLTHVRIVRDPWSFYHASSTLGVTRSFYTEYWGERVVGYRRVPIGSARARRE
jgi:peptidoglycan endopeptidase LytE